MDSPNTGIATEVSPPAVEQGNRDIYANSFNEAQKTAVESFIEDDGTITARTDLEQKPSAEPAKPAEKPAAKADAAPAESEFPTELMTGEKPAADEKDELDEIQPSAKMGQESRANFDKLKELARNARQAAAQAKKDLEAARASKPAAVDESEALKAAHARLKEYEQKIERADFTMSPKYQAIVTERDQAVEDAKAYVAGTEIDPGVIELAAKLVGPKRVAALRDAGLDAETIAAITPSLAHADRKERERVASLEGANNWREEQSAADAARAAAQKAAERAEEDKVYESTGQAVAAVFEPFKIIPGQDKWNAQVETLKGEAKEFFSGSMPIEKMAEIAYYGVGAKVIHKMFHAQRAEVKALKEQLGKLQAAQPTNGSTNGHVSTPAPTTYEELASQRASNFNVLMGRQ